MSIVGIVMLVVVVSIIALALMLTRAPDATPARSSVRGPRSPIDEAERILAARYAAGSITPQEYQRMLVILRK